MGWKDDLQDASFRGVTFECTSTDTTASKSLSIKQSPYSDKANVEDMGNDPKKISLNAVFTGSDYKTYLDALIAAMDATGSGELIHPIDGIMQVYAVNHTVHHDAENPDFCTVSLEFLRADGNKEAVFIPVVTPTSIDPASIIDAPANGFKNFLEKLQLSDSNQFFSVVTNLRNGINTARSYFNLTKSAIENILEPASYIVSLVDDITKLVTVDTSISAISKWRDLVNRIGRFEKLFQDDDSPTELQQLWRATQVASMISITQQLIANVRNEMAQGNDVSLTPIDLAVVRQQNRQRIQSAINAEREQTTAEVGFIAVTQIHVYKDLADKIHLQIQELIQTRPPITTTKVIVPCTLHFLAHQLYQDFTRADEIRRLNPELQNPAMLLAGMELTVYAR
ncbi:DNA circularization N-terminal domain-containing protein [Acinetobacter soli]|uniref:DNA circularization protein n=1 Tax=Acinetobacter soli TaxID=487316 RepID=UPI00287D23FA|nr:DNA circularization N-terminal domain-containing protein [Acinetobacter soli]MDS7693793.1 DNA circularization N-terminal domain-containing protein [Acinetobacter soli]